MRNNASADLVAEVPHVLHAPVGAPLQQVRAQDADGGGAVHRGVQQLVGRVVRRRLGEVLGAGLRGEGLVGVRGPPSPTQHGTSTGWDSPHGWGWRGGGG